MKAIILALLVVLTSVTASAVAIPERAHHATSGCFVDPDTGLMTCQNTQSVLIPVLGGTDYDGDGYIREGAASIAYVSTDSMIIDGRTYYKDPFTSFYLWLASDDIIGFDDCADSSGSGYGRYREKVGGVDRNHDGRIVGAAASSACVGDSAFINGRTYYSDYLGGGLYEWLDGSDIIGFNDTND